MNEEAIFAQAIEKRTRQEREAYLNQACSNDADLRNRVEALLQAHDNPDSFLDNPASDPGETIDHAPIAERPGETIGPYKLREQVGEGGMGVVFAAEQERPVRRKVALKIIKPGMDTKEVVARFEAERQALALMDHTNIAKVLDAGSTESGRPYFIMELVRGIPITEYCDQHKLTIRERLELFTPVCRAIQHAHQKGIIHRDVKPTNVLVTLHDGEPVPKVIDFGVAKAINQRLTERTIYTRLAQIIGTPMYMSPEQAELSGLDVDTRTDVYSLGVLLYELLTGTTPFDKQRFEKAAYDEIRRIVREEEPPKPSTRIGTLGETASVICEQRKSDPRRLQHVVRGDLDWIVIKALEKDRTRRYETASAFAIDIQRLLNDEPVEARPPSNSYRLRKFVRRNKMRVGVGSALLVAFLVASSAVGIGYVREQSWKYERSTFVLDNALAEAMSGNEERANVAIQEVRDAGVSDSWIEMLHGQVALYAGRGDEAIKHLQRATMLDKQSLTPKVMLASAYALSGDADKFDRLADRLEHQRPQNDIEQVFLGQALLYRSTQRGLSILDDAVGPGSPPLFHAILADALTHHAMETGDADTAMKAVRFLEAADVFMPESGYVLTIDLCAHVAAMRLTEDRTTEGKLRDRAKQLAEALREYRDFPVAGSVRVHFYDCVGDDDAALQASLEMVESGGRGYCRSSAAAFLTRFGKYKQAEEIISWESRERNPWISFGQAEVVAFTTEGPREIREIYETLAQHRAKWKWFIPEAILLYQDDGKYRVDACQKRLRSRRLDPWEQEVLEFVADKRSAEQLQKSASSSSDRPRLKLCFAEKLIGMKCLLLGDREMAKKHFQACLDTEYFGIHYYWASAFLQRLEHDESWPEWSEMKGARRP